MKLSSYKIKSLAELSAIVSAEKQNGKKIVHCHGVFDLLHVGHIQYFEEAVGYGDMVIVTLTPDIYVNKGPHRPLFTEKLRASAIAALAAIDYVAITETSTAVEAIHLLKPHFYVKGPDYAEKEKDYTGGIYREEQAVKQHGGQIIFTNGVLFSSTKLINEEFSLLPQEIKNYLEAFKQNYSFQNVFSVIQSLKNMKVLVVGEAIIDEYTYCETLGKSGKEPILAAREVYDERFAGGVLAVANHVSAFSNSVGMLTCIGKQKSGNHEGFIREKLKPPVEPVFVYTEDAPTIIKRRFVEQYPFQKLFETYTLDDDLTDRDKEDLHDRMRELVHRYDCVIVADYGHGMIDEIAVDILCEKARFLAVNTQVNASNHGFCTISKYKTADFISISEREIRLESRKHKAPLRNIVLEVSEKLSCDTILVTRGYYGCLCYQKGVGFLEVPAFTTKVVDRVGSGDALFAISSLCISRQAPIEIVGLIANVVGAQAVMVVGNKTTIEQHAVLKHVESLLK